MVVSTVIGDIKIKLKRFQVEIVQEYIDPTNHYIRNPVGTYEYIATKQIHPHKIISTLRKKHDDLNKLRNLKVASNEVFEMAPLTLSEETIINMINQHNAE